ncbi:MAG TPA: glycine cleavage system aminomethyltransferase GcvT [Acholeplasma sp.]|jgi:aminomethyltransferase|nr:glycine cleavage system aminomethyltransferase GcvT [Acholeplasmatales bacterium]HHV33651.1 glycine cleavage system aminomethyltransferase GcvT [Acholeplasma sp.]
MSDAKVPFGLKTTALYEFFKERGASFTDFGGYYMPVNFSEGIISEHKAVREKSGLFDISHMGEIRIKGAETANFLNYVASNDIRKIKPGRMQYNIIMQEDGGAVDDLMVYKFAEDDLWLVANASNKDAVVAYLEMIQKDKKYKIELKDESDEYAAIAIQGPLAEKVLAKVLKEDLSEIKYMRFRMIKGLVVSRSGYTGEDGFEVYGSDKEILKLTKELVKNDVVLCGLGSRDTLRFEAGLPLYGHEISGFISPIQAGMGFAVDYDKGEFIGRSALLKQKENLHEKIYGMELLDRGVLRQGYPIYDGDEEVGFVTSGFMIPGTKNSYANGLIKNKYKIGDELEVEVRNRRLKVRLRNRKYL